jgi:hypothetical protein
MGRRRGTGLIAVALAVGTAGCLAAGLGAPALRVPLLFGPVPCIGCGGASRTPTGAPVAHLEGRPSPSRIWKPDSGGGVTIGSTRPGTDANRVLSSTPCHDDLQLANVRVHAFGLAVLFLNVGGFERTVEGDATQVSVPRAWCPAP